jgi:hypothetical protein
MYLDRDIYPELVYSLAIQRLREQREVEQVRHARQQRRVRRAARVRARLAARRLPAA